MFYVVYGCRDVCFNWKKREKVESVSGIPHQHHHHRRALFVSTVESEFSSLHNPAENVITPSSILAICLTGGGEAEKTTRPETAFAITTPSSTGQDGRIRLRRPANHREGLHLRILTRSFTFSIWTSRAFQRQNFAPQIAQTKGINLTQCFC